MRYKRDAILIALSILISYVSWANPTYPWLMAFTICIPALWVNASSRWSAFLVYYTYLLVASSGLFEGIKTYFDSTYFYSLLIWSFAPVIGAFPLLIVWSNTRTYRVLLIPVVLVLLALPPFSLAGWSHPLVASGWLFPSSGWFGLGMAFVGMIGISYIRNSRMSTAILATIFFLAFIQRDSIVQSQFSVISIDTHNYYKNSVHTPRNYMKEAMFNFQLQDRALAQQERIVVYPEAIAGRWNRALSRAWSRSLSGSNKTVLFGAIAEHETQGFENVVALANSDQTKIIYKQRYPIPVGMWKPFDTENSTHAYWFNGQATVDIGSFNVGLFLCYESLLIYPILQTLSQSPDFMVVASSLWWSPKSIQQAQSNTMQSWSRLFSIPLMEAYNL